MSNLIRLVDKIREKSLEEEARVASNIRGRPKLIRPAATESEIMAAQARLGFSLPHLLTECYLRVGNGGFGPGSAILGIGPHGSFHGAFEEDLVGTTQSLARSAKRVHPTRGDQLHPGDWVQTFVVFMDFGCGDNGIIDCSDGSMLYDSTGQIHRQYSCVDWYFEDWVNDRPAPWHATPWNGS